MGLFEWDTGYKFDEEFLAGIDWDLIGTSISIFALELVVLGILIHIIRYWRTEADDSLFDAEPKSNVAVLAVAHTDVAFTTPKPVLCSALNKQFFAVGTGSRSTEEFGGAAAHGPESSPEPWAAEAQWDELATSIAKEPVVPIRRRLALLSTSPSLPIMEEPPGKRESN